MTLGVNFADVSPLFHGYEPLFVPGVYHVPRNGDTGQAFQVSGDRDTKLPRVWDRTKARGIHQARREVPNTTTIVNPRVHLLSSAKQLKTFDESFQ